MKKLLICLIACSLCACATIESFTQSNPALANAAIAAATATVIEAGGKTTVAARAAEVKSIATDVEGVLTGNAVTVAALEAEATSDIAKAGLNPADQALAAVLVATIVTQLNTKIIDGVLNSTDTLYVSQVLGVVISTAASYGA